MNSKPFLKSTAIYWRRKRDWLFQNNLNLLVFSNYTSNFQIEPKFINKHKNEHIIAWCMMYQSINRFSHWCPAQNSNYIEYICCSIDIFQLFIHEWLSIWFVIEHYEFNIKFCHSNGYSMCNSDQQSLFTSIVFNYF